MAGDDLITLSTALRENRARDYFITLVVSAGLLFMYCQQTPNENWTIPDTHLLEVTARYSQAPNQSDKFSTYRNLSLVCFDCD